MSLNCVWPFKIGYTLGGLPIFISFKIILSLSLKIFGEKRLVKSAFTLKHKNNKSNTKISTPYCIVRLYSIIHVFLYFIFVYNFLEIFWNVFNFKTSKICLRITVWVQSNPISTNIHILIKIYYICPIFSFIRQIITWINTIKYEIILIISFYLKDEVASEILS